MVESGPSVHWPGIACCKYSGRLNPPQDACTSSPSMLSCNQLIIFCWSKEENQLIINLQERAKGRYLICHDLSRFLTAGTCRGFNYTKSINDTIAMYWKLTNGRGRCAPSDGTSNPASPHQEYRTTRNAQQPHQECTTTSPGMHNNLIRNTQQPHQECTTTSPGMHNNLTRNTQQPHQECTTTSPGMHNNLTRNAQQPH